jgi:flagellar hook-basal body complex protein FliE
MNAINGISIPQIQPGQISAQPLGQASPAKDGPSFKDFLLDSIQEVNSMEMEAKRAVEQLQTGGDVNPAEVLTAVQKADIAFRMMIQVRNKMVQAYEEIKSIRV